MRVSVLLSLLMLLTDRLPDNRTLLCALATLGYQMTSMQAIPDVLAELFGSEEREKPC